MGVIIQSDNFAIDTILDICLVFVLGSVLLFFGNSMKNENRFVMLYISLFIGVVLIYNLVYLNSNTIEEKKEKSSFNILVFLNIYLFILMFVLSAMSYYTHTAAVSRY